MKDLEKTDLKELLKVASRNGISTDDLITICEELGYIARDNGYNDDLVFCVQDILENL